MNKKTLCLWVVLAAGLGPGSAWAAEPVSKPGRDFNVRSPGKPTAAVRLNVAILPGAGGKAAVAEALEVELELSAPADTAWIEVQVTPTDQVTLVSGSEARYGPGGKPVTHRVVAVPNAEGRHYLSVTVAMQRGDETRMRSFAVPLTVGTSAAAPRPASKGRVAVNNDGEAVVITHSR